MFSEQALPDDQHVPSGLTENCVNYHVDSSGNLWKSLTVKGLDHYAMLARFDRSGNPMWVLTSTSCTCLRELSVFEKMHLHPAVLRRQNIHPEFGELDWLFP